MLATTTVQLDYRNAFCRTPIIVGNFSMAAYSKCSSKKLHLSFLKQCYIVLTAKTIFDKNRLYCSRSLEIFRNISVFL